MYVVLYNIKDIILEHKEYKYNNFTIAGRLAKTQIKLILKMMETSDDKNDHFKFWRKWVIPIIF